MKKGISCNNKGGNWNKNDLAKGLVKLNRKQEAKFILFCLDHKLVPTITELRKFLVTEEGFSILAAEELVK